MRTGSISTAAYAPAPVPSDPAALPAYLTGELQKLQAAVSALAAGHVDPTFVAPAKPREGDIRLADGTGWDPGAGAGVYAYYGGAWRRLG